jgi:hypothetical protein
LLFGFARLGPGGSLLSGLPSANLLIHVVSCFRYRELAR